MKKLLVLLLFSFNAYAQSVGDFATAMLPGAFFNYIMYLDATEEDRKLNAPPKTVQASGTGETCNEALTAAKMRALESVNGEWIYSERFSKDGSYKEQIGQYSGGVIKEYKFLRNDCTFVIIEAQVVPRAHKIQSNSADVKGMIVHLDSKMENENRLKKAVNLIDDKSKAFAFKYKTAEYNPINEKDIAVRLYGELSFQEKWIVDYLELRQQSGWFNLPSFERDPKFVIIGYDNGQEVFRTSFVYEGQLALYDVNRNGVFIKPNKKETVVVKFRAPYAKLQQIDKFEVKVL